MKNRFRQDFSDLATLGDALSDRTAGTYTRRIGIHKFGINTAIGTGYEVLSNPGGSYQYLTWNGTSSAMRVKAGGNIADTAAGAGCQSVVIAGLDSSGDLAFEEVATAGASASAATTTLFSRVLWAWAKDVGANGVQTDAITIEDSGGVADYAVVRASHGRSELGHFTVPRGYRALITELDVWVDTTQVVDILVLSRPNDSVAAPTQSPQSALDVQDVSDTAPLYVKAHMPFVAGPLTDFWVEALASSTAVASCRFSVELQRISENGTVS